MILAGLVALAVVAQVVIIKTLLTDNADANLLEAGVWCGTSILNVAVLGRSVSKSLAWLYIAKLRPGIYAGYRRWSMEQEAENLTQAWMHLPALPLLAVWGLWTLGATMTRFAPVVAGATGLLYTPGQIILFWLLAFLVSLIWVYYEHETFDRKRRELEGLRPVYRHRFPVSELLSMYDCLRVAPRVFWEEYKDLPAVQVSEATNRKFRERAASYGTRGGDTLHRKTLIIAVRCPGGRAYIRRGIHRRRVRGVVRSGTVQLRAAVGFGWSCSPDGVCNGRLSPSTAIRHQITAPTVFGTCCYGAFLSGVAGGSRPLATGASRHPEGAEGDRHLSTTVGLTVLWPRDVGERWVIPVAEYGLRNHIDAAFGNHVSEY